MIMLLDSTSNLKFTVLIAMYIKTQEELRI